MEHYHFVIMAELEQEAKLIVLIRLKREKVVLVAKV